MSIPTAAEAHVCRGTAASVKEEAMRGKTRNISVVVAGALALLLVAFAGTAVAKDKNRDRIPDKWEKKFKLSLKVDQSNKDQDRDKVDNLNEFQEGTNPRVKDTNRNGKADGKEDADGDGLNNAGEDESSNLPDDQDTDNDGVEDGEENAGVIASFDGTTLTIDLAGGGQVSGMVTDQTEIKCETEDEHEGDEGSGPLTASASSDEADDSGEDQSGEDQPGDESGEDQPGEDDNGGDDGNSVCTTADLTAGTAVHEAELEGTTFQEIELVK
jgi:hypothetical protein